MSIKIVSLSVIFFLSSCANWERSPLTNCSFVPQPLKKIANPNSKVFASTEAYAMINDPVHNVAGVINCDIDLY